MNKQVVQYWKPNQNYSRWVPVGRRSTLVCSILSDSFVF